MSGFPFSQSNSGGAFSFGSSSTTGSSSASATASPLSFSFNPSSNPSSTEFGFGSTVSNPASSATPSFGFGSSASSTPSFGFGSSASSTPSFVFGSSASSTPASAPPFGFGTAASSSASAPSLFGSSTNASAAAPASSPFGFVTSSSSQPASSPFGVSSSSASTPSSSLFGAAPASGSTSLFGSSSSSSLFGATPAPSSTSASNSPLFGTSSSTAAPSSSLFGAQSSAAASTSPLFGAPSSATGSTPSFGVASSASSSSPSIFGATGSSTSILGSSSSAGSTPSLFASTSSGAAASSRSPFGVSTTTSSTTTNPSASFPFSASTGFSFSKSTGTSTPTITTSAPSQTASSSSSSSSSSFSFGTPASSGFQSSAAVFSIATTTTTTTTSSSTPAATSAPTSSAAPSTMTFPSFGVSSSATNTTPASSAATFATTGFGLASSTPAAGSTSSFTGVAVPQTSTPASSSQPQTTSASLSFSLPSSTAAPATSSVTTTQISLVVASSSGMDLQSEETIAVLNAENEYMEMERNEETETETEGQALSATQSTQRTPVRKKRKAKCWKEFTKVGREENGKERARCHHCSIELVIDKTYGTSTMNRHLLICPERPPPVVRPPYDHKIDREMTAEIIICHDLPFQYVEYEKVRARDRFLNSDCQHICRQTASADVYKRFEIEKLKLIDILAKHQRRVCFTADLWSARSTDMGYICLTAHYIDDDWKLNNKILAFCDFKPPHNGEEIAKKVYDCMKEWSLEKKVFSITLDNASANDSMQKILKHRLQSGNGLLCDGEFLHVRCCAHILNMIVQEGLELARSLLENIRESVKFVKASGLRKDLFATCVESVGIKCGTGLSLDVSTRWNSTYEMLARALKFRKAFAILNLYERGYKSMPSEDEWDRGEKICDLLKPFNTITTYFSGVKYPTTNVYFIQVWKIELLLKKYANCDDDGVKTMAWNMQRKFAKYWDQYTIILAMGAALDPRLKLQILTSAYNKVDPSTSEEKVEIVKKNLFLLFDEYKAKSARSSKSSTTPTPHELLTESPLEDDFNDDLFELENSLKSGSDNSKSILEIYLNEPRLQMKTFADMEVLSFWKENQQRYGDLASMASDLLSIPITTVASESAFSVGGRVLNPYRNRFLPKNVQALICTRNWLRGFAEFEGNIEDNFDIEDNDATKIAGSSGVGESNT